MKDNINLDELLKQELGGLSPEPPADVWQAINNSLPTPSPAATGVQGGISLTAKVAGVIITTAAVVATVAYMVVNKPEADTSKTTKTTAVVPSPVLDENNTQEEESQPQSPSIQSISTIKASETESRVKQKSWRTAPKNSEEHKKGSLRIVEHAIDRGDSEVKKNEVHNSSNTTDKSNENQKTEADERKEQESRNSRNIEDGNNVNATTSGDEAFARPDIPNVFTPNNDGFNDEYVIVIDDEVLYDLKITDVKGNVVFESHDKNIHWKGINPKTGNICEPGFYVLAFRYQVKGMKEPKVVQGRLLLKQ